MSETYYGEEGYLSLLSKTLTEGVKQTDRTGVGTRSLFDAKLVFEEGEFPFFTHRKVSPRLAFEELWFFLRGQTDTKLLEGKGVYFWKGNTTREFLDARGLEFLPEGDMGAAYSRQFRDAGGYCTFREESFVNLGKVDGVDQLSQLVQGLKDDRYSRRHLITLWNPLESYLMPLTPCWHTSQYVVLPDGEGNDVLHVKLINRSNDLPFGLVFAVAQYRMFQMALCKMFGFKLGKLSCDLSHIHIYENQVEWVEEILTRKTARKDNYIGIGVPVNTLDGLLALQWEDWNISYESVNTAPIITPRPAMAV